MSKDNDAADARATAAARALREFAEEVDQMSRTTAYAKAEYVVGVPEASLALGAAVAAYNLVVEKARYLARCYDAEVLNRSLDPKGPKR